MRCDKCLYFMWPTLVGYNFDTIVSKGRCVAHHIDTWGDLSCGWHMLENKFKRLNDRYLRS